ncbi:uncharacterized protein LOC143048571 [Mytilus galloprovincialis]|uniref:uncharacterized protein LOC143048571 n=1 Tax=Mytilus galloprovincialis TaxID=29158 RepID=UPI003F7B8A3A
MLSNETTTATTLETTISDIISSPVETATASTQVTTPLALTNVPDEISSIPQESTQLAISTSSMETITASTQQTTTLVITTSPDVTTTVSTQETTTSALTPSVDVTTTVLTQETTTSALTTSPYVATTVSTQETTTSALTTFPDVTTTVSTQETTTSALTTSPDVTTTVLTQETTISALTTSPDVTTTVLTQETTISALTTSPDQTTMVSTQETTTPALTTSPDATTMVSTQETTTSALTTSPDVATTVSSQETLTSAVTTSPDSTTPASTQETTTSALTTFPDFTTTVPTQEKTTLALTTSPDVTTTVSSQETLTSAVTTFPDSTTPASTQETTPSALTTSPNVTTTVSTQETTTSALTTFPDATTTLSTLETTTSALTTSPDVMTTVLTQETTTSALTTSPDVTTTVSNQETTTSALTSFLDVTTTVSTQETTTSALATSPDVTSTVSTHETSTAALTTSLDVTTTVSTKETTASALTTSPDVTTMVSTKETTTSALTTSPDVTTTVSTQETTTSAFNTSLGVTTTVSTQETTTSALTTSTDVTTTHNLETKTTVELTTSSPLKITTSTTVVTAYCPEEKLNNITWSHVAAGQKDTQKCPPGYIGNAFRKCNDNGDWEDPVYIECVNMVLHETSEAVNSLRNITDPVKVAKGIYGVLDIIDTTIGKKIPPTSGDLKLTTNILTDIIDIGTAANASVDSEKFGDVLNSVLDSDNSGSWNEVNSEDQSDEGASKIMGIVDSLGSLFQKNLLPNQTITINKTNIVIEVSTLKKNLTFPPDSNSMSELFLANQPSLQDTLYTAALYRTLSGILPTTPNRSVGSDMISVSFGQAIDILTENITIRFEQNKKVPFTDPKISCGYWNFSARSWANSGCYLQQTESNVSTCTCNHLTNFAILMSPSDFEITDLHQIALEIITFIGCGLSILGCTLTLITYYIFWRYVKNEWTVILSNMCVVLVIGYSVFLSSTTVTDNDIACIIVTAVLHYVFLVVFFLMLCEGISVARYVTVVFKRKSEVRFYLPFAWGVPLVIVGITLGVTRLKGYHSEKYCWLSTNNFVFMAFVGPALLIILINIGIIHVVLKVIYSTNAMMNERLKKKVRAGVKCMAVLIPVLGLSWLFGILAFNEDTIIFQYLFGISTSLQGFIIFIREAVSNKKLHEGIRRAVHRYRSNSMLKASSKAQSSGLQYRFDFEGNQVSADEYQYNTPMRANLKTRTFI